MNLPGKPIVRGDLGGQGCLLAGTQGHGFCAAVDLSHHRQGGYQLGVAVLQQFLAADSPEGQVNDAQIGEILRRRGEGNLDLSTFAGGQSRNGAGGVQLIQLGAVGGAYLRSGGGSWGVAQIGHGGTDVVSAVFRCHGDVGKVQRTTVGNLRHSLGRLGDGNIMLGDHNLDLGIGNVSGNGPGHFDLTAFAGAKGGIVAFRKDGLLFAAADLDDGNIEAGGIHQTVIGHVKGDAGHFIGHQPVGDVHIAHNGQGASGIKFDLHQLIGTLTGDTGAVDPLFVVVGNQRNLVVFGHVQVKFIDDLAVIGDLHRQTEAPVFLYVIIDHVPLIPQCVQLHAQLVGVVGAEIGVEQVQIIPVSGQGVVGNANAGVLVRVEIYLVIEKQIPADQIVEGAFVGDGAEIWQVSGTLAMPAGGGGIAVGISCLVGVEEGLQNLRHVQKMEHTARFQPAQVHHAVQLGQLRKCLVSLVAGKLDGIIGGAGGQVGDGQEQLPILAGVQVSVLVYGVGGQHIVFAAHGRGDAVIVHHQRVCQGGMLDDDKLLLLDGTAGNVAGDIRHGGVGAGHVQQIRVCGDTGDVALHVAAVQGISYQIELRSGIEECVLHQGDLLTHDAVFINGGGNAQRIQLFHGGALLGCGAVRIHPSHDHLAVFLQNSGAGVKGAVIGYELRRRPSALVPDGPVQRPAAQGVFGAPVADEEDHLLAVIQFHDLGSGALGGIFQQDGALDFLEGGLEHSVGAKAGQIGGTGTVILHTGGVFCRRLPTGGLEQILANEVEAGFTLVFAKTEGAGDQIHVESAHQKIHIQTACGGDQYAVLIGSEGDEELELKAQGAAGTDDIAHAHAHRCLQVQHNGHIRIYFAHPFSNVACVGFKLGGGQGIHAGIGIIDGQIRLEEAGEIQVQRHTVEDTVEGLGIVDTAAQGYTAGAEYVLIRFCVVNEVEGYQHQNIHLQRIRIAVAGYGVFRLLSGCVDLGKLRLGLIDLILNTGVGVNQRIAVNIAVFHFGYNKACGIGQVIEVDSACLCRFFGVVGGLGTGLKLIVLCQFILGGSGGGVRYRIHVDGQSIAGVPLPVGAAEAQQTGAGTGVG